MEWITNLFEQYGYFVLFLGLFAESLALPFPGELAMAISGHMATLGSFNIPFIMFFSYIGAISGTTLTYYLGYKLGKPFFDKYGKFFFLNQARMDKITKWFDQYGSKIILISYFVPGLRHFTGYVSGILKVRLRIFFVFNYIGGLLWVITYVMIGKLFGQKIEQLLHTVSHYSTAAIIAAAIGVCCVLLIRKNKAAILNRLRMRYKS
ncbi:DedA family protein [Paenibacillus beijingensis]|uniref:Membrane protein n=1 Tax=Paenibacillus beijingensis TaxID=1126833 RepID=A0A0D5NNZ3_9BACL|nr:DedA family protein [Paenibacillus beijingensis]AJY76885.1 membrane protein [Paenibacillus beijingensis]